MRAKIVVDQPGRITPGAPFSAATIRHCWLTVALMTAALSGARVA